MKKILLIDDEIDILNSVKMGLERDGFVVDTFNDPLDALHNFKADTYEVAILDVRMPKMNGFQLFRELEKRDAGIRVMFFSAFEEYRNEFTRAFPELDESRFLKKPSSLQELENKVLQIATNKLG